MADSLCNTQRIDKIPETEFSDDPRTTVADEESQKFCGKWANKPKDHLNEIGDRDAAFEKGERYLVPFSPATVQEITHTRPPIRRSRSEFNPYAVLSGSRIVCHTKRELQEGKLMRISKSSVIKLATGSRISCTEQSRLDSLRAIMNSLMIEVTSVRMGPILAAVLLYGVA